LLNRVGNPVLQKQLEDLYERRTRDLGPVHERCEPPKSDAWMNAWFPRAWGHRDRPDFNDWEFDQPSPHDVEFDL
jgi:hypothetical protein